MLTLASRAWTGPLARLRVCRLEYHLGKENSGGNIVVEPVDENTNIRAVQESNFIYDFGIQASPP